ncbi:glycosyltransferase family 2 protein [Candidatus Woesearchaeota archaeon]|nr:glycosyltransferase family 2 protein [Candidatus Woesearchaeota archaeon]
MNWTIKIILYVSYFVALYFSLFWFLVFIEKKDGKHKLPSMKTPPNVSIVIPAYNEEKRVIQTLKSALSLKYPSDKLEIFVVDDGSKDDTYALVEEFITKKRKFPVTLVRQKNGGKGAAMNKGNKFASGEFFVCLDADSYVTKNALFEMLPYFGDEKVAAVLPVLKVRNPKNLLEKLQSYEYLVNMFFKELMGKLDCVHVIPGPFSIYRRRSLLEVGGFDENRNLTEDLEMALRLQKKGYKIIQLPHTNVTTVAPSTLSALYRQRNRWFKGAVINSVKYREMLFNKKYGDFGFIQMPILMGGGVIAIILVISFLYYTFEPGLRYIYNLGFVNFDFWTFIKTLELNFYFLDLDYSTILVAVAMLAVSIFIFIKSHKFTREHEMRHGLMPVFVYMLGYFLLLGLIWVGVALDILLNRQHKW